jgi:hypothetical protein
MRISLFKINIGFASIIFFTALYFILLLPLAKPFPYSDDWMYVKYITSSDNTSFTDLIKQHNDHRIPLQKIFQILLLNITGGDFRILISFNILFIAATSICWIHLARIVTGKYSWSECIVPPILINFGFNTIVWGFCFQFVSGIFFLSLAIVLWARAALTFPPQKKLGIEYLVLLFCALCGGNGLISSSVIGSGILIGTFILGRKELFSKFSILYILLWLLTICSLWTFMSPSSATLSKAKDPMVFLDFAYAMSKSWLGVYAISSPALKAAFGFCIFLVFFAGIRVFLNPKLSVSSMQVSRLRIFPVLLIALQSIVVLIAVTFSRAASQPWAPGLELHYGYLMTPLPLSAWIVILNFKNVLLKNICLTFLCLIVFLSYSYNFKWRIHHERDEFRNVSSATSDIFSLKSSEEIARNHIKQFWWKDDQDSQASVSNLLENLRKMSFWQKSPQPFKSISRNLVLELKSSKPGTSQLFYDLGFGLSEANSSKILLEGKEYEVLRFPIPSGKIGAFRFDPLEGAGSIEVRSIGIQCNEVFNKIPLASLAPVNQISSFEIHDGILFIQTTLDASDPQIAIPAQSSPP